MKERQKVMVERLVTHVKEVRKQQPVCLKPNQIRCASEEMRRVISRKRLRTIEPAIGKIMSTFNRNTIFSVFNACTHAIDFLSRADTSCVFSSKFEAMQFSWAVCAI